MDDEALVRKALQRACLKRGHEVIVASGGQEGVQLWCNEQPDVVFLDILMPDMNGPLVIKEVAGVSKAKVILMSAYTGEYDLKRAQSSGADMFIPKPFENIFEIVEQAEELYDGQ